MRQFSRPVAQLRQGNVHRIGKPAKLHQFFGTANIEQEFAVEAPRLRCDRGDIAAGDVSRHKPCRVFTGLLAERNGGE